MKKLTTLFQNRAKTELVFLGSSILGILVCSYELSVALLEVTGLCQSDGCSVVEELTKLPTGGFEIIGIAFFSGMIALYSLGKKTIQLRKLILLGAISAESFLIGYQLHVAHTYCLFCLGIGVLIFVISLTQFEWNIFIIGSIFISLITVMNFVEYGSLSMNIRSIQEGTIAKQSVEDSEIEYLLIFSKNCSHCQNVIQELKTADWASVSYNPIHPIDAGEICAETDFTEFSADCTSNRNFLKILGKTGVPILLVTESSSVLHIFHGEQTILEFLKKERIKYRSEPENRTQIKEAPSTTVLDENCETEQGIFYIPGVCAE